MRYRIAVDTGGTFTDVALSQDGADPVLGKALTTRHRIFEGVEAAISNAAGRLGADGQEVIRNTSVFIYGTTHATNAIVTGATAKTALICTKGFADTLVLREGGKRSPFDYRAEYPKPYIPRALTFEIDERINAEGGIVEPLKQDEVRQLLSQLKEREIEAVAVCLLWSVVNAKHEEAVGHLIEECLPGIPYTLSHQLNPIVREYRRTSSAAIDASLKPLMQTHLGQFDEDLRAKGFQGSLLTVTSMGGAMHVHDLMKRPIYTVRSGPAMAPVAAKVYGTQGETSPDLIVCDTGGTTFDVSLIRAGSIKETRETWLGGRFVGHLTGMSSVDVQSIGSGGGSIAWIDGGGLLRVGPQSAGASPGPACYGRGGTQPTVTDAALILGFLDPGHFLGGRMKLDIAASRAAVAKIASELSLSVEEAAYAIYAIATQAMVSAIREITIEEGIDPRECQIVAGGGAAGLNAAAMARELSIENVIVPRTAGALSACGGLYADIVTEASATFFARTGDFPTEQVNEVLGGIDRSLSGMKEMLRQNGLDDIKIEYRVEARYPFQSWELDVPLPFDRFRTQADVDRMKQAFHAVHERIFAVSEPGQEIECLFWRARLSAPLNARPTDSMNGAELAPAPRSRCNAFFGREPLDTPRYEGKDVLPGMSIAGPAIVDEATTTIVVPPKSTLRASEYNYILSVAAEH